MPVPSSITDLDTVAANNWPQDSDLTGPTVASTPRALSAILKKQFVKGTDIAVSASGTLSVPSEGSYFVLTGTGFNVTGLTDAYNGRIVTLELPAGLTLVNSASLILKAFDRVTFLGDTIKLVNKSAGVWKEIEYNYINGKPALRGHRNGTNQSIPVASTFTKMVWLGEDYDRYNMLNTTTGTITIPTPGRYRIFAQIKPAAISGIIGLDCAIYKNGVATISSVHSFDTTNPCCPVLSDLELTTGDTIDIYAYFNSSTGAVLGQSGNTFVCMSLED